MSDEQFKRWNDLREAALERVPAFKAAGIQMPESCALAEALSLFHGDTGAPVAIDRAGNLRELAAILEDPDGETGAVSAPEVAGESSTEDLTGGANAINAFQQRAASALARLNAALDPLGLEEFNTHEPPNR